MLEQVLPFLAWERFEQKSVHSRRNSVKMHHRDITEPVRPWLLPMMRNLDTIFVPSCFVWLRKPAQTACWPMGFANKLVRAPRPKCLLT